MGWQDTLGQLVNAVATGKASDADIHAAYDKVAGGVPKGDLAEGISHVFNSDQTPDFGQMVGGLFNQSSPEQKAALLNQFLGALGPNAGQLLGSGALAGLLKPGATVTPQQAQSVSPDAVQVLAQQASQKNPSIVDTAAQFYAQHPALVKTIGAGALAVLMSRISSSRR
jgi:hypothetical protein